MDRDGEDLLGEKRRRRHFPDMCRSGWGVDEVNNEEEEERWVFELSSSGSDS